MKAPRRNRSIARLVLALGVLVHAQIVFAGAQSPTFSSAASATFTMGTAGSFTVAVIGSPAPTIQAAGVLPTGISFTGGSGGSAVLAGTAAPGTVGRYTITLSAANGVGSPATQTFTLTVVLPLEPALAVTATADAWWRRPEVVTWTGTPNLNDLATVEGWGGTAESPSQARDLKRAADLVHAYGRRYVASISGYDASSDTYAARPDLVAAAVIDIDGRPLVVPWESPLWWGNWNLPVWQSFLLAQATAAVDAGADGIIIDELDGTAGSLIYGGSFAPQDMSLFRSYLSRTYTAADLQSRYGIADLATFDYGDYIRSHGLAATWKATPNTVPLFADFQRMQQQANRQFLTLLIGTTRDYARTRYGRYVTFSANTYAMAYGFHDLVPILDYFSVESPFVDVGYLPDDTPIVDLKLAAALSKPAWLFPGIFTVADWYGRNIDTLVKLYTALSYAGGGALFAPYNLWGYSDATGPVVLQRDVRPLRPIYSMAREYSALLSNRASVANVALLYSKASEHYRWATYRPSYRGTARALLKGHVQYDVVPLEDGDGLPESPGVAALARYSVAYLPTGTCLSSVQVEDLLAWVNQGGTLVLYGETGIGDLNGVFTLIPRLDPYRSPGSRTLGAGRVVTAATDLGTAYHDQPSAANLAAVLQYVTAGPAQPVTTDAPENVIVLADLALSNTALVVHVVNGSYDAASDSVGAVGPMTLTFSLAEPLKSASTLQAYRVSPDRASVDLLPVSRNGANASVSLSGLSVYDLIVVMDASTANAFSTPVVTRFTDALAGAAAKGRDVSSLVVTRDAINAALASNNYLRARHLAQAAQPDADRANGHRVLFSEAHNERSTLSPARADLIYPGHPGWSLSSRLVAELPADFAVERSESPITPELLAGYDVLWLAASSSVFQPSEITAIHDFVAGGGGLLVLGDYALNASLTPITSAYGISLTGTRVFSIASPSNGDLTAVVVQQHEAVRGVPWLSMNWGTTLSTTSPATVLIETDADAFADADRDQVLDPGEQTGPLPVVAVSASGLGRVFVASDNAIADEAYDNRMPLPWVRAALGWLVRNTSGPQPLDLTAASVAVVPPGGSHGSTSAPTISLSGTVSSRVGVSSVTWSSKAGHGVAAGTTSWTTGPVSLDLGSNRVTIAVTDLEGTVTVRTVSVTRLRSRADFDGDRSADAAVYRPASGTWFSLDSSNDNASYRYRGWGLQASGDVPVVGDFDGDGVVDPTVFRPASGTWFVLESHAGFSTWKWIGWGVSTDRLVPSDYDGDGITDAAVYRPSTGEWFIRPSSGASSWSVAFGGAAGDIPVPGDYDGDGKTDLAIYRPVSGTWFILTSSSNFATWTYHGWGVQAQGDVPVPGDYDADGKTDLAVYRPASGTWFILESHADFSTWQWIGWGVSTDQLMPADYDGDGVTDAAVYRPSTHEWYIRPSSGAPSWRAVFGQAGDTPLHGIQ